jgi:hypothetical protein
MPLRAKYPRLLSFLGVLVSAHNAITQSFKRPRFQYDCDEYIFFIKKTVYFLILCVGLVPISKLPNS